MLGQVERIVLQSLSPPLPSVCPAVQPLIPIFGSSNSLWFHQDQPKSVRAALGLPSQTVLNPPGSPSIRPHRLNADRGPNSGRPASQRLQALLIRYNTIAWGQAMGQTERLDDVQMRAAKHDQIGETS
jgi:hypothetical protein